MLTGHSHTYERSYLLDGHYGSSGTLDPVANVLDPGDGRDGSDGAYEKPNLVAAQNAGAVYAVAGSSGKVSRGYPLNHPAMFVSLESLGSLLIDVSGNRMDVAFLDQAGVVRDAFSMQKTPDSEPPVLRKASAEDATHVLVEFNEPLDPIEAGNSANYTVAGLSVSGAEIVAGNRVRLTTTAMVNETAYLLSASNVEDLSGNPIVPGSTIEFTFYETVTLAFQDGLAPEPDYSGTRDATIRQASATTAHGLETTLRMDGDEPAGSTNDMSVLAAWDVSRIPAGSTSTVQAASIRLQTTNISNGTYTCQGLLRPWTEAETTWNLASAGTAWGSPGATAPSDRASQAVCSVSATALGPLTVPLNTAGLALVQSWVDDQSQNHGIVISSPTTTDGADFHSRESATAVSRPMLEVTYRVASSVPNQPPVADFTTACTDLDCTFTDASTDSDGNVVAWAWDFGDGNEATERNPLHTYASAGNYTVMLTSTDDDGTADAVAESITVSAPLPWSIASRSPICRRPAAWRVHTSTRTAMRVRSSRSPSRKAAARRAIATVTWSMPGSSRQPPAAPSRFTPTPGQAAPQTATPSHSPGPVTTPALPTCSRSAALILPEPIPPPSR